MDGIATRARKREFGWAAVAAAVIVYLALAVPFARVQDVWIDESTQLLGARLPLGRMLAWLAGAPEPLGVPADRMPPLSYLVDWLWQRLAGGDPYGFRLLHLAFAIWGVGLTTWLAARRYGIAGALATGLLLALSPGLVSTGVEIRAYPLFLCATAVQLWLLAGLCDGPMTPRRLAAFAGVGLVAVYVHFFGLVSTSAFFVGLLAARARDARTAARIALAWGAVLVLSLGLLPFVGGARAISQDAVPVATDFAGLAFYLPHIYGHAAMLFYPALAVIVFAAFAGLLAVASARAIGAVSGGRAGFEAALGVALLAGVAATVGAGFVAHGFDPMKPSYSLWMVPTATQLAGAACAGRGGVARLGWGLSLVAVAALLPITLVFAQREDWFAHGPAATIADDVGAAPAGTALVYLGPGWGYGYFPLIWRYGGRLAQFRRDEEGALHPIGPGGGTLPPVSPATLDRFDRLVVAEITPRTGEDLRTVAAGTATMGFDAPAFALPGWQPTATTIRPGLYWLQLSRWDKDTPR